MTSNEKKVLQDFAGFLLFVLENQKEKRFRSFSDVLFNLSHDIRGLVNQEKCFVPRTTGYHKRYLQGKKAKRKPEPQKELLEALKAAKQDFVASGKRWESEDLVDAAIKKAEEGGQP